MFMQEIPIWSSGITFAVTIETELLATHNDILYQFVLNTELFNTLELKSCFFIAHLQS